jgi:hypothetical protein
MYVRRREMTAMQTNTTARKTHAEAPNFADLETRKRLTDTGVKAFIKLAKQWELTNPEAAALLGVSPSTWDRIKRGDRSEALNQDQLTRISALIGTFKGLHLLFADQMADRWPQLSNKGSLFGNRRPIDAMIEGGIPRMLEVRRYIDAVRGGL